ncbi:hypothetical protein V2J94_29615 [Streptomyces sp. DSM 41524]|uniref:WD40 repeat domain-containing protein n=1 Tax=Streptomyces asiaticus subsp. ignotus TaxID=3098222 RepID=A0ABU7Q5W8_9ACTN|nr:hypothetical protein [Streptomyces sp. DSM 41524]
MTVSGTVIQQWDLRTGKQRARFDTKTFRPRSGAGDGPQTTVSAYPAANRVAVLTVGDPVVRIVDLATRRTTSTVKTVDDAQHIQFDRSGRYFALARGTDIFELWRREPLRKELGPLRSFAEQPGTPVAGRFLDSEGRFLLAANSTVQTYDIGKHRYLDSYDFGRLADGTTGEPSTKKYSFIDVSKDGKTVLYSDEHGIGGPLALDPAKWQRKLCRTIAYRTFTADEQDRLPARVSGHSVCPGP